MNLVKKAIDHFTVSFSKEDKTAIEICCHLIQFRMSSTLLVFKDRYFEYNGGSSIDEKGLAIGRYKSSFLADLVASYLFEMSRHKFYLSTLEFTEMKAF